jgi:hypothetical protein
MPGVLTSFENFENELFTIFIKNFNTLELTLGTEVNSIVHCCWYHAVPEGVSCQDCWHDTTTATMWGSGTNVMRPYFLRAQLRYIKRNYPNTKLIWFQILPRTNWRHSKNNEVMDKARKRLNSYDHCSLATINLYHAFQGSNLCHRVDSKSLRVAMLV